DSKKPAAPGSVNTKIFSRPCASSTPPRARRSTRVALSMRWALVMMGSFGIVGWIGMARRTPAAGHGLDCIGVNYGDKWPIIRITVPNTETMDKFQQMQAFVAVVDAGSFVKAADALGSSKAAVSRHVGELESRLGARLLNRTTRRLSLTEEGRVFLDRCRELLADVDEAEAELSSRSGAASGL